MKDGQWYTISGWMGNSLGLRGNDLICFAVIYGFSMDGESQFKGNLDYVKKEFEKIQKRRIIFYILSFNFIGTNKSYPLSSSK